MLIAIHTCHGVMPGHVNVSMVLGQQSNPEAEHYGLIETALLLPTLL